MSDDSAKSSNDIAQSVRRELDNKGLSYSNIGAYDSVAASNIRELLKYLGIVENKTRRVSIYYVDLKSAETNMKTAGVFSNLMPGMWRHGCTKIQRHINNIERLDDFWMCLFHSYTDSHFKDFSWNVKTRNQFITYVNKLKGNMSTDERAKSPHVEHLTNGDIVVGLLIVERSLLTNKNQLWFMVANTH